MDLLQCITPPSQEPTGAVAKITAFYNGAPIEISTNVNTDFQYIKENTPVVFQINPAEAAPGDEVSFVGRWMTSVWSYFDYAKVNDKQMELYLLGEGFTFGSWDTMNITAKLGGNTHGDTGAFVQMKGNFGNTFSR